MRLYVQSNIFMAKMHMTTVTALQTHIPDTVLIDSSLIRVRFIEIWL